MIYKMEPNMKNTKLITILLAGLCSAIGLNFFLVPSSIFSAGINGISQLLQLLVKQQLQLTLDTGLIIMLLNLPILIISYRKLGKQATIYTLYTVLSISGFTMLLPVIEQTTNLLLNAIIGGIFIGLAAGLCLKNGFSTGGLDVISLIINKTTGKTVGKVMLIINSGIILVACFYYGVEQGLYSLVAIFCLTQTLDNIYTSDACVTAFIVTKKGVLLAEVIQQSLVRGITISSSTGAFENSNSQTLMIVLSRMELSEVMQITAQVDQQAFVNVVETSFVSGNFVNYSPTSKS